MTITFPVHPECIDRDTIIEILKTDLRFSIEYIDTDHILVKCSTTGNYAKVNWLSSEFMYSIYSADQIWMSADNHYESFEDYQNNLDIFDKDPSFIY